jgi:hypothetical protein
VFLRKSKNTSLMQALSYKIRRKAAIDDDDHLDLSTTSTVCDSRFVLSHFVFNVVDGARSRQRAPIG